METGESAALTPAVMVSRSSDVGSQPYSLCRQQRVREFDEELRRLRDR